VQFAKWKGGRVIGTASGAHVEQVRQLGADKVIDYRKTKFEEVARDVDVVLDTRMPGATSLPLQLVAVSKCALPHIVVAFHRVTGMK